MTAILPEKLKVRFDNFVRRYGSGKSYAFVFFVVAICVAGLVAFSLFSILLASLTLQVDSKINKKATIRGDKIEYTLILYGVALIPIAAYLSLKTTEWEFNARSRKRHSFIILPYPPSFFKWFPKENRQKTEKRRKALPRGGDLPSFSAGRGDYFA